ncbi:response regulator, partial [bacterium]|nr:response regulator [bacterium]
RPDVVLADIKMPVMDGLTLLRKVKKEYPDIKVVLLSRHEDFKFAKTGMQLGAEGYILKFSIEEDILEVFPKLFSELKNDQNRKKKLEELLAERKNLLYRNFFRRVIEGGINDTAVNKLMEREQDINLQDGLFCVACLYVEKENNHQEMSIEKKKMSMEWLLEMAEANSRAEDTNILFSHCYELIAVHYSNRSRKDQLYRMVLSWSKRFRQKLIQENKQRSELAISIGIGSIGAGWNSIYPSYIQARKASFFRILDNPIPIQEWETIKNNQEKIRILSSMERKELVSSALWGDKERLEQKLNYLFEILKSTAPAEQIEDVRSLLIEMFGVLYSRLGELNIELNGILIEESELFKTIYSFHNFSELEHWTRKAFLAIAEPMNDTRNLPAKRNIKKTAQYVSANYGEKISM